jgi:HAD superfamily hydrolase (TIGR01509 family)
MNKELIIFDCFGTLLNIPQATAYKKLISELNLNSKDFYLSLIMRNNFDWHSIALDQGLGEEQSRLILNQFNELLTNENSSVIPYKHTLSVLEALREKYTLVLLSNLAEGYIPCVENLLSKHLDKIFYSCDLNMKKPDINIFLHVLNWHKKEIGYIDTKNVYLLDDKIANIITANNLGMNGFLIHTGSEQENIKKVNTIVDFFNILEG